MLSAALIYGIVVTIVAFTLGRWWFQAEQDAIDSRNQRDRYREEFKEANDRKWELIARNNEALAQLQESKRTVAKLADERDIARKERDEESRARDTLKGYLKEATAERDEAIREQVKWRETAERARDLVREIDRMLSELPEPADASNIPF